MAPKVNTCNSRVIDFFVVSEGLRQAALAAYTIGDGFFDPRSAVRLILRGEAREAVVRQLKVPLGVGTVLPYGPPNQNQTHEHETGEQLGSDYAGLTSKIEKELCMDGAVKKQEIAAGEEMVWLTAGGTQWERLPLKIAGRRRFPGLGESRPGG